jgi:hypothetical protein
MPASTPCSASSFSFPHGRFEQAALIANLECFSLLLRTPEKISSESRNERQNRPLKAAPVCGWLLCLINDPETNHVR